MPSRWIGGHRERVVRRRWATKLCAVLGSVMILLDSTACVPAAVAAASGNLRLTVTPALSAADSPLIIRVSGALPGRPVTLSVTSVDAKGVEWRESINYLANRAGAVDPALQEGTDRGGMVGPDAMAPVDLMTNPAMFSPAINLSAWPFDSYSGYENAYSWAVCKLPAAPGTRCSWSKPRPFTFTASSGTEHTSVTVERGPAAPVTASLESVTTRGFYGVYWRPPADRDNHIGVLEFGGSGGGVDTLFGAFLASHGYPTLDLAYFDAQGLPQVIGGFSLGYFANALRWLRAQPGVSPERVWVAGWSLGSEAALQLGVYYPSLVHGVLALEPNDMPACSWDPGTGFAIWTLGGMPLPCTVQSNPLPSDDPDALIPVAKIRGPVFIDCGGADGIWNSCTYADNMMARLQSSRDRYPHELLGYPEAGHGLGAPVPYDPGVASLEYYYGLGGQTVLSNPVAVAN
ncbi:MAG TPA: acyl-CoA thioester hydrolase/BAAT C-terminal domain-containing protein, partial [Acidimicrobiales bacterium]|nr:acyl-CoA thioester hydrolase/BAAT C-terminal domain-containing protein [Acidimicrobiales bacterium]